jgi:hypothetical protein
MTAYCSRAIIALTREIANSLDAGRSISEASYDDVAKFVLEQLNRMPWFFRLGVKLGTVVFGLSLFLSGGGFVGKWKKQRASAQVTAWKKSRFGMRRNLVKLYTSLIVLALYSRAEADQSGDIQ